MSSAENIAPNYEELESCHWTQKKFHSDVSALLDDVGTDLWRDKVVRDYDIESTDPVNGDPGDITCTYHNRALNKSVFVWVGESPTSSRDDGLTCSIQLFGERPSAKPGSLHSVKLSDLKRLDLDYESIKAAILHLLA